MYVPCMVARNTIDNSQKLTHCSQRQTTFFVAALICITQTWQLLLPYPRTVEVKCCLPVGIMSNIGIQWPPAPYKLGSQGCTPRQQKSTITMDLTIYRKIFLNCKRCYVPTIPGIHWSFNLALKMVATLQTGLQFVGVMLMSNMKEVVRTIIDCVLLH